ncbi:hypothetical protein BDZ89DRAFT_371371 [Hymenopellis radicata]|nr:hypothetical protein BDZ89DRAFT_371371 [Hymenopellis radicata]
MSIKPPMRQWLVFSGLGWRGARTQPKRLASSEAPQTRNVRRTQHSCASGFGLGPVPLTDPSSHKPVPPQIGRGFFTPWINYSHRYALPPLTVPEPQHNIHNITTTLRPTRRSTIIHPPSCRCPWNILRLSLLIVTVILQLAIPCLPYRLWDTATIATLPRAQLYPPPQTINNTAASIKLPYSNLPTCARTARRRV